MTGADCAGKWHGYNSIDMLQSAEGGDGASIRNIIVIMGGSIRGVDGRFIGTKLRKEI
jgi:hypothetical protein